MQFNITPDYPYGVDEMHDIADKKIPDPSDFISYLYYRVDMDLYWDDVGELFEGLAISILSNHGLANMLEDPYYDPAKDARILNRITTLKNNTAQ